MAQNIKIAALNMSKDNNNYSSRPNGLASDSEAMRARGIIVLVNPTSRDKTS